MNTFDSVFPASLTNSSNEGSKRGRPRLYPVGSKHAQIALSPDVAEQVRAASVELDRPVSWIVKQCVMLSLDQVRNSR